MGLFVPVSIVCSTNVVHFFTGGKTAMLSDITFLSYNKSFADNLLSYCTLSERISSAHFQITSVIKIT